MLVGGLVIAVLLNLDGHCVLHASAVEIGHRAVAFGGTSGAGKSTIAALLCAGGARLVSDDTLRIDASSAPRGVRGGPELRLRRTSDWVLDHFEVPPTYAPTVDDRLGVRPLVGSPTVPLAAIVLPQLSRTASVPEVRPVTGAEAQFRLAGLSRVPGWRDPHIMGTQFAALAALVDRVPVAEAVIPWGPPFRSPIVPALLDLFATLSMTSELDSR